MAKAHDGDGMKRREILVGLGFALAGAILPASARAQGAPRVPRIAVVGTAVPVDEISENGAPSIALSSRNCAA